MKSWNIQVGWSAWFYYYIDILMFFVQVTLVLQNLTVSQTSSVCWNIYVTTWNPFQPKIHTWSKRRIWAPFEDCSTDMLGMCNTSYYLLICDQLGLLHYNVKLLYFVQHLFWPQNDYLDCVSLFCWRYFLLNCKPTFC